MKNIDTWYDLDNVAKIFPSTSSIKDTRVFRFACSLKEDVKKDILQKALDKTMKSYPMFSSILKRGMFWYYLETSNIVPIVKEENDPVCDTIYRYSNKNLLFNITYFKKRINLEIYHALSDGTGALQFLKTVVLNYLKIKHKLDNDIKLDDISSLTEKEDDSFKKYYKRGKRKKIVVERDRAYKIKNFKYSENRIKVIEGIFSTIDLLNLSHKYNTSLTVFLTSVLLKSIEETMRTRDKNKPVSITIPVDLRRHFKSSTVRNFFVTMNIKYKFTNENSGLETIIAEVDRQFKDNLTKDSLFEKFNHYAAIEHKFLIRIIPLFLKDIIMKMYFKNEMKSSTTTLSNIGVVNMPEEVKKYINMFTFFYGTKEIHLCMCSYDDKTNVSFTSRYIDSEIEKNFFRKLSYMDMNILINTNQTDEVGEI